MCAKKRTAVEPESPALQEPRVMRCMDCALAYDFCCPGYDGHPISARCPRTPFLVLLSNPSCKDFVPGGNPPEKVTAGVPGDILPAQDRERKVPLFRLGESRPWKWIRSCDIPPGGIYSDGTPVR